MFRAAFPDASEDDEKNDTAWIKQSYDIAGANGGYRGNTKQILRLAGIWLPVEAALAVAESYAIHTMVKPLTEAEPDPSQHLKKSANGVPEVTEIKPFSAAAPAPAKPVSPPAKRRRMASPSSTTSAPLSPPAQTRKLRSSKSPAPVKKATTPKPRSSKRLAGKTAVEAAEEEVANIDIVSVNPEADIEESKQLVDELKASYGKPASKSAGVKRPAGDDVLTFEPKEPEIGERVIAPAPRRIANLRPEHQALTWGSLAFAVGMGATALLPQFFF